MEVLQEFSNLVSIIELEAQRDFLFVVGASCGGM